jgi:Fe-S-cluster-containing hydrogenase component 2
LLELMRNVLEDALDNEAFRDALNQVYRRRALESHLASMPIFENASPGALDAIRKRAKLVSYDAGTTIYHEGDPADAMYFIRHGTVKIFRGESDGRVLGYRSRGKWLGVGSMLAGDKRRASAMAHEIGSKDDRPRSAAAGRVELVRIDRALFEEVADEFPELHETAAHLAEQHSIRSSQQRHTMGVENLAGSLGLLQGEKLMLIDLDRCTRCDDCVRACADTHDGVAHLTRSGPRFGPYLIPGTCRQCLDPVCLVGCPVGSIHRGTDGEIVIENWCIGCGLCAEQCPYDAIRIGEGALRKAQVCDQCTSLGSGSPMCVYACPHDAAHRVDGHSFFADWVRRS